MLHLNSSLLQVNIASYNIKKELNTIEQKKLPNISLTKLKEYHRACHVRTTWQPTGSCDVPINS